MLNNSTTVFPGAKTVRIIMIIITVIGGALCALALADGGAEALPALACFAPATLAGILIIGWTYYRIEISAEGIAHIRPFRRPIRLNWGDVQRVSGSALSEDITLLSHNRKLRLAPQTSGYIWLVQMIAEALPDLFWQPGTTRIFRRSYATDMLMLIFLTLPVSALAVWVLLQPDILDGPLEDLVWRVGAVMLLVTLWSIQIQRILGSPLKLTLSPGEATVKYLNEEIAFAPQQIEGLEIDVSDNIEISGSVNPSIRLSNGRTLKLDRAFKDGHVVVSFALQRWLMWHVPPDDGASDPDGAQGFSAQMRE